MRLTLTFVTVFLMSTGIALARADLDDLAGRLVARTSVYGLFAPV